MIENVTCNNIQIPFARMIYADAMAKYGSDKPDTRFGMEMVDISDIVVSSDFKVFSETVKGGGSVKGLNIKKGGETFSRRQIDELAEKAKEFGAKGLAWINITSDGIKSPIAKFLNEETIDKF